MPRRHQHIALDGILEGQRQLYNAALEERIEAYRKGGIRRTYFDQTSALTEWRRTDPDAAAQPLSLQRHTLKRVDDAFNAFFRRLRSGLRPGFPRYRGKSRFRTFGFRQFEGISLTGASLSVKGMRGPLRIHLHRPLPAGCPIKTSTLTKDTKGWVVALCVDVPPALARVGDRSVGIDLGITTFAVLSDGGDVPSLRAARRAQAKIRLLGRSLARKQPGSRCREKARRALGRAQARVTRTRLNHLHAASADLVRRYEVIAVEALPIARMVHGRLARDIYDASWGLFVSMLRYKAENAGIRVIEVDPRGTTQNCSGCGIAVPKQLSERWHACPSCGLSIDRDLNASRNVLYRAGVGPGLQNVASEGERAGGNLSSKT